jgi:hypothetical protein
MNLGCPIVVCSYCRFSSGGGNAVRNPRSIVLDQILSIFIAPTTAVHLEAENLRVMNRPQ